MDIVNPVPNAPNINRFPQREDERKKVKLTPESTASFHDALMRAFEEMDNEEDNVVEAIHISAPPVNTSPMYSNLNYLLERR